MLPAASRCFELLRDASGQRPQYSLISLRPNYLGPNSLIKAELLLTHVQNILLKFKAGLSMHAREDMIIYIYIYLFIHLFIHLFIQSSFFLTHCFDLLQPFSFHSVGRGF